MQDDFQTENGQETTNTGPSPLSAPPVSETEQLTVQGSPEPDSGELFSSSEASIPPSSGRAPAATASSYRDIIAERLARKAGPGTAPRPMAHASDVENAPPKAIPVEKTEESATASVIAPIIEESTKSQEIASAESPASEPMAEESVEQSEDSSQNLSSRERARLRQQERAALRRGEQRRPQQSVDIAERETEIAKEVESNPKPQVSQEQKDIIAERLARKSTERPQEQRQRSEEPRAEQPRERRMTEEGRPERRQREERRPEERRPREERKPQETRREGSVREGAVREERRERPQEVQVVTAADRGPRQRPERIQPEVRRREATPAVQRPSLEARSSKVEEKGSDSARALASKLGISVVVPLYNEQESLRELTALVKQQCLRLAGPKYEIIYINDGSTDRSADILQDILATSSRVTVITFRRNLGKSAALAAGFAEAQHGIVITMDADLQDDPHEFVNLIGKLAEGYDLVSGWKKKRHDPISKTGPSKFFNSVTSFFSGIKLHDFNCGLKAYRKEVTDSLQVYGELHRYLPALAYWQGFRVTEIPVVHHPRKFGKSKFGSSRFFKGFLDLLSIVFTNRYGKRPLHLFGTIGTLLAIAGFVIDIWVSIEWIFGKTALSNRPILQLGVLLILVGVQLISLGLLGEMIVKNAASRANLTYQKEKGRPSAEARERRASRAARIARVGGRPSGERRPRR